MTATNTKIRVSLLATVVLSLVFIVFLIYPLFKEIKNVSQQVFSQRQALLSLESKIKNLEEFEKKYHDLKPNLEKIDGFFIDGDLPVDFVRFLEKISSDSGVSSKISPSAPSKIENDPWPSSIFQLNITGSFPGFLKFLETIKNSQYLVDFQGLSVSRQKSDINASLTIKVFSR